MILQNQRNSSDRRKSGIMLGLALGAGKRGEAKPSSLAESRCAKDSAFIFSPNFVGLETRAMQQNDRPFCFSNSKTEKKLGIFTREIGKSGYS